MVATYIVRRKWVKDRKGHGRVYAKTCEHSGEHIGPRTLPCLDVEEDGARDEDEDRDDHCGLRRGCQTMCGYVVWNDVRTAASMYRPLMASCSVTYGTRSSRAKYASLMPRQHHLRKST